MSKSYTSNTTLMTKAREAWGLRQWHATNAATRVKQVIAVMDSLEETMFSRYGLNLEGLNVLDIGTGQQQIQSTWLARKNRVTGIDLDVIAKGWSPRPYLKMVRENGANRAIKTLARKALGLDAMYSRALREELGRTASDLSVHQMDVTDMHLASDNFDFVYCSSVLQCVPDIRCALQEMNRVLKPGGIGYFTVQLYSSETGSLDPRLYSGHRSEIPYWAHLRPDQAHKVTGNAWLNKLRLREWRQHIEACLPSPTIELSQPQAQTLKPLAQSLQQAGQLSDYTLEELLTHELRVSWCKEKNGNGGSKANRRAPGRSLRKWRNSDMSVGQNINGATRSLRFAQSWRRILVVAGAILALGSVFSASSDTDVRQANDCMPKPSACGFPDATNTGVPAGTVLSIHSGDLHITRPGTVIDSLDIVGCVYIEADNVTLQRSRVRGDCPYYAIRTFTPTRSVMGATITDVEIDLRGSLDTKGIAFDGYTATRVHFRNGADCAHFGTNVTIQDSFCDVAPLPNGSSVHADGFQSDGGNGITIRHNTIRNPNGQTSAIIMGTNSAPIVNVRIIDNLIAGGGWALYCAAATGSIKDETVSGNRFARTYFPTAGAFGPAAYCERIGAGWAGTNVWDDTGKPL